MMSALKELYQQVILDHNRNPKNFRAMQDATRSVEGYNPLCGDHYTVFVRLEGEVIADVSFTGTGCAISKASASVMSAVLKGRTRDEAERLFNDFHRMVTEGAPEEALVERLGKLAAFAGVSEFPARVKCASLPWHTLHAALEGQSPYISTE
ncbi:MAG TPA: SUF system NifU family Fe-S cluster assembly protein [Bacteroidota bacterium]|nr:SUF system NifU family Fe-S cluster assembly protein [Bacteroidota bacterium]